LGYPDLLENRIPSQERLLYGLGAADDHRPNSTRMCPRSRPPRAWPGRYAGGPRRSYSTGGAPLPAAPGRGL